MKNSIYNYGAGVVLGFLLLLGCNGCDSFVEVDQPNSQLTADAVFESRSTANAAVADIYSQMRENGFLSGKANGLSMLLGAYGDELTAYDLGIYSVGNFYNNSLLASNTVVNGLWRAAYSEIYSANAVYTKTANSGALSVDDKSQFMGEALFLRAINHFYLVCLFGDVPYVTSTDYVVNGQLSRMASSDVFSRVESDLEQAIELLPEQYVTNDRARANKAAARAVLARVYLYQGRWAEASNMASAVLNDPAYAMESNLANAFLRGSTGTILQFASAYEGHNTDEGAVMILLAGPPNVAALSNDFVAAFADGDLRRGTWVGSVSDGTNTWYFANKYKEPQDTGVSNEFSVLLRIEEQYLIRAEARAVQGDLIGAKQDLNTVRNRAGLPDTNAATAGQIVDAVINERRFEFFTEHGHRFFDLKRNGALDAVLGMKAGWGGTDALWPLPQSELLLNPALAPQNPGY